MQQSVQQKNKYHIRPSLFLNELDLNSLLPSPKIKTQSNEQQVPVTIIHEKQKKFIKNQIKFLPSIQEELKHKQQDKHEKIEKMDYNISKDSSLKSLITPSHSFLNDFKLPNVSQFETPQIKTKNHRRNLTDESQPSHKKVEFRPSILVIDFVNDIMKKGVIDGSSKPLTKKRLERQNTRFLPLIQKV